MRIDSAESMYEDEVAVVSNMPISIWLREDLDTRDDDDPMPLLGPKNRQVSEDPDEEAFDNADEGSSDAGKDYGPWRHPSKSTVDERDTLLVSDDAEESERNGMDDYSPTTSPSQTPRTRSLTLAPRTVVYD